MTFSLIKYIVGLRNLPQKDEGFTLIELVIATFVAGFLAAISVPSWMGFINQQRINAAKDVALSSIRNAQSQAIQTRSDYRASFRTITVSNEPQIQFAIHPANVTYTNSNGDGVYDPKDSDGIIWENLQNTVELDTETTIDSAIVNVESQTVGGSRVYFVEFDFKGFLASGISGQGSLVFQSSDTKSKSQRCIIMSSLLGAMRSDRDNGCN